MSVAMTAKVMTAFALLLAVGTYASAQTPPPDSQAAVNAREARSNQPAPPLQWRETWQQPPHDGELSDSNRRVTPAALTNPELELLTYGADAGNIGVYHQEQRYDLWTGMARSPVAILLRDRRSLYDVRGLARLRAVVRTFALHELHPIVQLTDGSLYVGSQTFQTEAQYIGIEVSFDPALNPHWYQLDPKTLGPHLERLTPDLSRVDAVGLVDLAPGAGHGGGSANVSTIELYATPVPR